MPGDRAKHHTCVIACAFPRHLRWRDTPSSVHPLLLVPHCSETWLVVGFCFSIPVCVWEAGTFCPSSLRLERSRAVSWDCEGFYSLPFRTWESAMCIVQDFFLWDPSMLALGSGCKLCVSAASQDPGFSLPLHSPPCPTP